MSFWTMIAVKNTAFSRRFCSWPFFWWLAEVRGIGGRAILTEMWLHRIRVKSTEGSSSVRIEFFQWKTKIQQKLSFRHHRYCTQSKTSSSITTITISAHISAPCKSRWSDYQLQLHKCIVIPVISEIYKLMWSPPLSHTLKPSKRNKKLKFDLLYRIVNTETLADRWPVDWAFDWFERNPCDSMRSTSTIALRYCAVCCGGESCFVALSSWLLLCFISRPSSKA